MKAESLANIKKELQTLSNSELQQLCLRLGRFKKENKELLTYLLFEAHDESNYIENIKQYINTAFQDINTKNFYYIKKSIRKILRQIKTFIRYTLNKETEAAVLLYFCKTLKAFKPSIKNSTQLQNLYDRQFALAKKAIATLHDDLQYDYNEMIADWEL